MNKKTIYLSGMLLAIVVGSFLYWKFCCNCNCETDANAAQTTQSSVATTNRWGAMALDGKGLTYKTNQNFNYKSNQFNYIQPLGDSVNMGVNKLKESYTQNPNQKIVITGYCRSDEKNNSVFENLGFARANDVKKHLVNQGIHSENLEIKGVINDQLLAKDSIYSGPISFSILASDKIASKENWSELKEKINANPLTIYFSTNQSELKLTDSERQQIANIQRYLDHVPNSKLLITGHTDNVGNHDANVNLSKSRAQSLKLKLEKNGIDGAKIMTDGKGPNEPIAENTTAEGKAKNRRSVLIIQ